MKKRIIAFVLGAAMLVGLTGCGSEISNDMVTVKDYKGLKVAAVEAAKVTDAEVEDSIAYTMNITAAEYAGEYGIKDRAAKEGDTVLIDYKGMLDGVAFEGGTAEKQTLTLGSNTFIDGFEDEIIGHMPGETFDINVTFPENYGNEQLNGQPVVFTIVFHAIVPTELTDEIATAIVGSEITVEDYKKQVKEDLEVSNQQTAEADYETAVYGAFLSNCKMDEYPQEELDKWIAIMEDTYGMYASYYGMEVEEFLQTYYGTSCEAMAKEQILFKYAVELVAEEEGLTLSLEEYEDLATKEATNYGYASLEEYEKSYEEYYGEGYLETYILQNKVMEWLVNNSSAK